MKVNPELIESVLKYVVEGEHNWPREGTILIFLPGLQEIQTVHEALLDSAMFGPRLVANKLNHKITEIYFHFKNLLDLITMY